MLLKMIRILIVTIVMSVCCNLTAAVRVTAIGRGIGKGNVAREQALADALRDAIRKGAGVNILSATKATDYILDYDRIFSRAFGYIKSYKITKIYIDEADFFTVEIDALVGKGTPGLTDYMAMRQIIAMKGTPRLLIRCKGNIKKVGDSGALIAGQLREIALKCGFQTVRLSAFKEAENKRAKRDLISGKIDSAAYRKIGVREDYDFVIDADVNGEYVGVSDLYGIKTQRFSIGADLGATYPNGNSIAQVTLPSRETDIAKVSGQQQAARSALMNYLGGETGKNFRALLMSVLSAWISEFDTGTKITVEITGISRKLLDNLVGGLRGSKGINAVQVREFDATHKSTIEVESQLESLVLAALIEKLAPGKIKTDRSTSDYIQMSATMSGFTLSWGGMVAIALGLIFVLLSLLFLVRRANK
jgi:hypothetical protein